MKKKTYSYQYDVVVVGGGMSGICAAIASAREGNKTVLIQNRPVLGGNASSEVRVDICGADYHATRKNARETGIIEEILLENRSRNPNHSFSTLDMIMWEKVKFQKNLDLFLNTQVTDIEKDGKKIIKVMGHQLTTEKDIVFQGAYFIDTTGDGMIANLAEAEFMEGRESSNEYGEKWAPEKSDRVMMGSSLLFKAEDMGYPVEFQKPFWANTYTEEDFYSRDHTNVDSGYWWIEIGGVSQDTIKDGEEIRDELYKILYGVWDHIKNSPNHQAENYALEWVGALPGRRESRRVKGDYVLNEKDLFSERVFHDAVAYGGWPMDMHVPGGMKTKKDPTNWIQTNNIYTIPYRSLYSKDIENLFIGGRAISSSKMAFGSTRVMATCATVGQAIGTASAIAVNEKIGVKEVINHIEELQEKLIKDDCYIPGYESRNNKDHARKASINSSSETKDGLASNIINGKQRDIDDQVNCWISKENDKEKWIELTWRNTQNVREVIVNFDSNLSLPIMITMSKENMKHQKQGMPVELVRDYDIELFLGDRMVEKLEVEDNRIRHNHHILEMEQAVDRIKITVKKTYGSNEARIFEVKVF